MKLSNYLYDNSNLGGNKKGQNRNKSVFVLYVVLPVQISNLFLIDLKLLARLVA